MIGAVAPGKVGAVARIIGGSGDYKLEPDPKEITVNSLVKPLAPGDLPRMHSSTDMTRVVRREFLGLIPVNNATDGPAQVRFVINPGDATTFPWLHNVARNYAQWLPLGMAFEYKATCGTAVAATPNIGVIRCATQYDVYEPRFGADVGRMMNHFASSSCAPHTSLMHAVECAPEQTPIKPLFIRPENPGGGVAGVEHDDLEEKIPNATMTLHRDAAFDARLYDLGRFEMQNSGATALYVAGELWITYDIVLMKPRIQYTGGNKYDTNYEIPLPEPPTITLRPEYTMAVYDVDIVADPEV